MGAVAGAAPAMEQREELYDPLATPDVDKYIFLSPKFTFFKNKLIFDIINDKKKSHLSIMRF
ncbi:hypothetical protein LguiA_021587 [Lonicera macranthoides]